MNQEVCRDCGGQAYSLRDGQHYSLSSGYGNDIDAKMDRDDKVEKRVEEQKEIVYVFDCPFCSKTYKKVDEDTLNLDSQLHVQTHAVRWYITRRSTDVECEHCGAEDSELSDIRMFRGYEVWECNECGGKFINSVEEDRYMDWINVSDEE